MAPIDAACPAWIVDMRALRIAGATIAAAIVMVVLLLVIGIPSGFMTSAIQDRVERATGYRLTIAGATRIGLWPSLNVTLNDVTLQDPDPKDRDTSNRLTVGSVKAILNSIPREPNARVQGTRADSGIATSSR